VTAVLTVYCVVTATIFGLYVLAQTVDPPERPWLAALIVGVVAVLWGPIAVVGVVVLVLAGGVEAWLRWDERRRGFPQSTERRE